MTKVIVLSEFRNILPNTNRVFTSRIINKILIQRIIVIFKVISRRMFVLTQLFVSLFRCRQFKVEVFLNYNYKSLVNSIIFNFAGFLIYYNNFLSEKLLLFVYYFRLLKKSTNPLSCNSIF